MQRQQHRKHEHQVEGKPAQRRGRRSWGELLAGWLLLLWGGVATIFGIFVMVPQLLMQQEGIRDIVTALFLTLHGPLCFLGAICSVLRHRAAARWLLAFAALCLGAISLLLTWLSLPRERDTLEVLAVGAGILVFSVCLLLLARWLGRQEDSEA